MNNLNFINNKYKNYLKINLPYKNNIILNQTNCDICNKKNFSLITEYSLLNSKNKKYIYFPYVFCNNCGNAQQLFKLNKKFYNDYYNLLVSRSLTKKVNIKRLSNSVLRGKILLNFLEKKLKVKFKNQNVLDIGCGHGGMLLEFYKKGCTVSGSDPDKKSIQFTKKKYRFLNLKVSDAENLKEKKNFYDLIIINGSLEHVYDPNIVMKKVSYFLKNNGYLYLEGKGYPLDKKENFFNFSHQRIFNDGSFTNLCSKNKIFKIYSSYNNPMNVLKLSFSSKFHGKNKKSTSQRGNLCWIGIKKTKKNKVKLKKDFFFKNFFNLNIN